jgi:hypothetical protein
MGATPGALREADACLQLLVDILRCRVCPWRHCRSRVSSAAARVGTSHCTCCTIADRNCCSPFLPRPPGPTPPPPPLLLLRRQLLLVLPRWL